MADKTFSTHLTSISEKSVLIPIAPGWARNKINTNIFRRNSMVSQNGIQYALICAETGSLIFAKRSLEESLWQITESELTIECADAHNSPNLAIDSEGFLHLAWSSHSKNLMYYKGLAPGSFSFTEPTSMTGVRENTVTYPQFYSLNNAQLICLFRHGFAAKSYLMMNSYDTATKSWIRVHPAIVSGEGNRGVYWEMTVDYQGYMHLSWVWRDSTDANSNHGICYARSKDNGMSWERSNGKAYDLPITIAQAEYAVTIPTRQGLINQTSICADAAGNPTIATFWNSDGVPQYHTVHHDGKNWNVTQISKRTQPFTLEGVGTKRLPLSRPQIIASKDSRLQILFSDAERRNGLSVASGNPVDADSWKVQDLISGTLNAWEPTIDHQLWKEENRAHIFIQASGQGDNEQLEEIAPQMTYVFEWERGA